MIPPDECLECLLEWGRNVYDLSECLLHGACLWIRQFQQVILCLQVTVGLLQFSDLAEQWGQGIVLEYRVASMTQKTILIPSCRTRDSPFRVIDDDGSGLEHLPHNALAVSQVVLFGSHG